MSNSKGIEKLTVVYVGQARWGRGASLTLEDDKVVFDCSDDEYGPVEFDLQMLVDALKSHLRDDTDLP
jgi:hypothetical protein